MLFWGPGRGLHSSPHFQCHHRLHQGSQVDRWWWSAPSWTPIASRLGILWYKGRCIPDHELCALRSYWVWRVNWLGDNLWGCPCHHFYIKGWHRQCSCSAGQSTGYRVSHSEKRKTRSRDQEGNNLQMTGKRIEKNEYWPKEKHVIAQFRVILSTTPT